MELEHIISYLLDAGNECRVAATLAMPSHIHREKVVAETAPSLTQVREPPNILTKTVHVEHDAAVTLPIRELLMRIDLSIF